MSTVILDDNMSDLIYWLKSHESDIAHGINDFGDLRHVFWDAIGRYPERDENIVKLRKT